MANDPVDFQSLTKAVKEELLTAATGTKPPEAEIAKPSSMDPFIYTYLVKAFDSAARTRIKATPEDALFVIHTDLERSAKTTPVSRDDVKRILDRNARAAGAKI